MAAVPAYNPKIHKRVKKYPKLRRAIEIIVIIGSALLGAWAEKSGAVIEQLNFF